MKSIRLLLVATSMLLSSAVFAEGGSDRAIERMQQLRDKAEAVLVRAEKAEPGQRHVHMKEHMTMLKDLMGQLHQDHPKAGMSKEDHLAWMEKHDKMVDDVLSQMVREHKLMMADKECHP
ncbi:co-regulatory protein PtrA N-terminal domain-containing protein [Pseudomonas sichuanensis]|uniref:co-regulatory protein PtrA N-terminal domain-containing protein n=1 Tax=Pseudomonas sichuanensis TaxID=2213015 RepID=UPI002ACB0AB9|nr:co-regulatory protein PtrA N-terminal domain-containing protein [Pseudomonas sichuanensis]